MGKPQAGGPVSASVLEKVLLASYFDLDMKKLGEAHDWTMTGALLRQHAAMMADPLHRVATPARLVP